MQASKDQNFVKGKLGVWCVDGITTIPIAINPVTGGIITSATDSISYIPKNIDPRDQNYQSVWCFEGSDGLVYPANVTAEGHLLVAS